jgi:hypothetical protein
VAHVRDRPSLRESNELVTPSGRRYRWASDEPDAANRPRDERYSDIMPGGYETADAVLPRKPGVDYSDLERLTRWTKYDASGGVIWQGRLERAPRVSGDQIAISPSAVGYQAHLEDDKSARAIFRDINLSAWGATPIARRVGLATTYAITDATQAEGGIRTSFTGPWAAAPGRPLSEAWYDANGISLGAIYYSWTRGTQVTAGDANWTWEVALLDAPMTASDNSGNLRASGPGAGTLTATTDDRVRGLANLHYASGPAGDQREYAIDWDTLAVYGNHGLTLRGTEPDAGFYDADMVEHVLGQWCPLISYTDESIIADPFIIPHMVFLEPTTPGEMIRQITRFGLRDWAVWEGPTFWLHDRGARGRKWRARVGPAQLEETGPQVDRLWNGVVVSYQDVDGTTRTVGPTGSGADTEDSTLTDTDPENPANRVGIRRWATLAMGTSTSAGAIQVGARFLEETAQLDNSGRARIVGHVQDDRGVWHPYSHVRAGDQIAFIDAADTSYRRIVKTDKSRADRSCTVDLDAPPEGLQALLERLGVVLVSLEV